MAKACIGDEYVQPAPLVQNFLYACFLGFQVAHVSRQADGTTRNQGIELGGRLVGRSLIPAGEGYLDAFPDQGFGDSEANPFTSPGNEGYFSVDLLHVFLVFWR